MHWKDKIRESLDRYFEERQTVKDVFRGYGKAWKEALTPKPIQGDIKEHYKKELKSTLKGAIIIFIATVLFVWMFAVLKIDIAQPADNYTNGWLWYDDSSLAIKKKKEPEKNKNKDEFVMPVVKEAPGPLKKFLKEPTLDNAKDYLAWQYQYMKQIEKISQMLKTAYLMYGDSVYPVQYYPDSEYESRVYHNRISDIYDSIIEKFRSRLGLIFFYKNSCKLCQEEKDIISAFVEKYNISARGVPVDGQVDPTLPFASGINLSLVSHLNIRSVPTTIAVLQGKDGEIRFGAIGRGLVGMNTIRERLVNFLMAEGEITGLDIY